MDKECSWREKLTRLLITWEAFGKYAVPLVQEDYPGGPLSYNENPAPGKTDFKFDTPEQAEYFAKNYKKATAAKAFNKKVQGGDFVEKSGLSAEDYETKYSQAVDKYGEDAGLAFDPQTQEFRPGSAFLGAAPVVTEVDRDVDGNPVFKSDMAKDRYYANKHLGEDGGRQMQDMQTSIHEATGTFAKNYLAPVAGGMLAFQALPYVAAAGTTTYGAAAPILGPIMNSSIAGIPGLTLNNTMAAGFASDFLVNRAPKIPGQISSGNYGAAAENIGIGALDLLGLKGASGLRASLKSSKPNSGMQSRANKIDDGLRWIDSKVILPLQKKIPYYQKNLARNKAAMDKGDQFARDWYANPRTRHHLETIGEELAPVTKDDPFLTPMAGQTKAGLTQAQRVLDTHQEGLQQKHTVACK